MEMMLGGVYWNPTFNENASSESVLRYFAGSAPKLDVNYIWGDLEHPYLRSTAAFSSTSTTTIRATWANTCSGPPPIPGLVFTGGLTMVDVNKPSADGPQADAFPGIHLLP